AGRSDSFLPAPGRSDTDVAGNDWPDRNCWLFRARISLEETRPLSLRRLVLVSDHALARQRHYFRRHAESCGPLHLFAADWFVPRHHLGFGRLVRAPACSSHCPRRRCLGYRPIIGLGNIAPDEILEWKPGAVEARPRSHWR